MQPKCFLSICLTVISFQMSRILQLMHICNKTKFNELTEFRYTFYFCAPVSWLGLFFMHHKSSRHSDKSRTYQLNIPTAAFKTVLCRCTEYFHMISLNAEAILVNPCWVAKAVVSVCLCALTNTVKKGPSNTLTQRKMYAADFKYICPQRDGKQGDKSLEYSTDLVKGLNHTSMQMSLH